MITDKWRDTNHGGPSSRIEGNFLLKVWCANKVKHDSVLQDVWMGSITRINSKPSQLSLAEVSDGWHRTKAEVMAWCDLSVGAWK